MKETVLKELESRNIPHCLIGTCSRVPNPEVVVRLGAEVLLRAPLSELRLWWEETSYRLELEQSSPATAAEEWEALREGVAPAWTFPEPRPAQKLSWVPVVGVVREEGSNGDREMAAAFLAAGFQVFDITMTDLLEAAPGSLGGFQGLAFVGGFSYADVLGSAKGWAGSVRFHPGVRSELEAFRRRPKTFSLGVCNGCQLMARLGWLGPVRLVENLSGRFESRFTSVRVESGPALLEGLQGATLGIWAAHGEGRFVFESEEALRESESGGLVALRYVDPEGVPTTKYPWNPNGSVNGIAGLVTADGRHLALMPHPERCFLPWQWAHWPPHQPKTGSPWLALFRNAAALASS